MDHKIKHVVLQFLLKMFSGFQNHRIQIQRAQIIRL